MPKVRALYLVIYRLILRFSQTSTFVLFLHPELLAAVSIFYFLYPTLSPLFEALDFERLVFETFAVVEIFFVENEGFWRLPMSVFGDKSLFSQFVVSKFTVLSKIYLSD